MRQYGLCHCGHKTYQLDRSEYCPCDQRCHEGGGGLVIRDAAPEPIKRTRGKR